MPDRGYAILAEFNTTCINISFSDTLNFDSTLTKTKQIDAFATLMNANPYMNAYRDGNKLKITVSTTVLGPEFDCSSDKKISFDTEMGCMS